jgi:hypothetical protein
MSPRILNLTASVGAGHNRAAQAIELALRELCPNAITRYIDVLDLTNAAFRRFYGKTYFDVVAAAPHLVGYLYDRLDKPLNKLERVVESPAPCLTSPTTPREAGTATEDCDDKTRLPVPSPSGRATVLAVK